MTRSATQVKWSEFHPESFPRGGKYRISLQLGGSAKQLQLALHLVRGASPGRRLVALAGVHGDEYEGVLALLQTVQGLDPKCIAGDLLTLALANPPAFWAASRNSPIDGKNMARTFPGDLYGSPTESLAYQIGSTVIAHANFLLDLHTGGIQFNMPALVGFDQTNRLSSEAAVCFGAKVLWGHSAIGHGRSLSAATAAGVPWLYTEGTGGGRIVSRDLQFFRRGLKNLLRFLEIIPGKPVLPRFVQVLDGDGNLDAGLTANTDGFFVPRVDVLQRVQKGELLGEVLDMQGEIIQRVHASHAGVIGMIRALPVVNSGDPLAVIARSSFRKIIGNKLGSSKWQDVHRCQSAS